MGEITTGREVTEVKAPEAENFQEIKPQSDISVEEARHFIDSLFDGAGTVETGETENPEADMEQVLRDYFDDLKSESEYPETIPDKPFDTSDIKKRTPEENAEKREEFDDQKARLKQEWEEINGRPWPKYDHDVYSANGKLIRKAGSSYDAHHIQPLGMGGENVASNITPLSAEVHYDKQGIHAPDSPYGKLDDMLGGMDI